MRNFAIKAAVIYFVICTGWILASDWVLGHLVPEQSQMTVSSVKGVLFVLISAIVLYILLYRYIKRIRLRAATEKIVEKKLDESESKLRTLLNNSDEIIWMYDEEGNLISYNHPFKNKFTALLGLRLPEGRISNIYELPDNRITEMLRQIFERVKSGEHLRLEEEFYNQRTQRPEFYDIVKSPIYDADHQLIGVGCFARDITPRILAQKQIEEKIKQLKEIAWLQSHTVRRPLANIMGLVELIKMNTSDKHQIDEAVQMMEQSCKELDDIIREVVKKAGNVK